MRRRMLASVGGVPLPYDAEVEYIGSAWGDQVDIGCDWYDKKVELNCSLTGHFYGNNHYICEYTDGIYGSSRGITRSRNIGYAREIYENGLQTVNGLSSIEVDFIISTELLIEIQHYKKELHKNLRMRIFCECNAMWDTGLYTPRPMEFTENEGNRNPIVWLRYMKVWDGNDVLIRDLIPVVKDGKGYLFDRCGSICEQTKSSLYSNENGTDFLLEYPF